ncbi:hypothetical protein JQX13_47410 [Archangium violaceum]|uniref:hypothetical protein n=1 Tax=Archangium violaceum TaxID=83451 RepID=UPI00193B2C43|nr:hypothetical protein [Archangium violaceum]QRK07554.1 hypothetical protein JQX13_47410 [Archangium violaceum]
MRPLLPSLALLFVACSDTDPRPPPSDRFVYPSGIVHRSVPGSTNGILYVSSANFDRCYDYGSVMAVNLDQVGPDAEGRGLLPLGSYSATMTEPAALEQLNITPDARVYIQSYAGEMALREGATPRLYVPARADGDQVHYIDIKEPTRLACAGTENSQDCVTQGAVSLTQNLSGQVDDLPRASAPFGVSVDPSGSVWVTHLNPADSPERSLENYATYVVRLPGDTPSVSTSDFFSLDITDLPQGGSNSVVADERYVFVSGRQASGVTDPSDPRRFLVRVLDKQTNRILDPGVDLGFSALEARGIALTPNVPGTTTPRRLYVAVRSPDSLVTVNVAGLDTDTPSLNTVGSVPLPTGPTEIALVSRGGTHGELVLVSCSTAGVVAIYDPDVGQVVAQVAVGETDGTQSSQPFGLAVQRQGNAARVFVSNFGDGRISVIDIPDLDSPQQARLVAHIGARQDQESSSCQEVQQ